MPRNKTVTVNGKQVTVKEHKIREFRENIIPKLSVAFEAEDLTGKEIKDLIPLLESKLVEIFPEITESDIEESYPSEIEALITAWIDVNFMGLKKIYRPLFAFKKMASVK